MTDQQETGSTIVTTSPKGTLDWHDAVKGLVVAILTPALLTIYSSLQAGSIVFDWKQILTTAGAAGLGYLIKNFFTPSQTIIKN